MWPTVTVSGCRHDVAMTNFDYFDEQLFDMAHRIARFGFTTMSVNTGECSVPGCTGTEHPGPTWTYSIGMLEHNHPEVVVVGALPAEAYPLIDLAFEWHHLGLSLPSGRNDRTTVLGATITTVPVPDPTWLDTNLMAFWHNYYVAGWPDLGSFDASVVQLVVADDMGRFPWDDGCDNTLVERQPIIEDDDSAWTQPNRATRRSRQRSHRRRRR